MSISFEDFEAIYTQDAPIELIQKLADHGYTFEVEDGKVVGVIQPERMKHGRR